LVRRREWRRALRSIDSRDLTSRPKSASLLRFLSEEIPAVRWLVPRGAQVCARYGARRKEKKTKSMRAAIGGGVLLSSHQMALPEISAERPATSQQVILCAPHPWEISRPPWRDALFLSIFPVVRSSPQGPFRSNGVIVSDKCEVRCSGDHKSLDSPGAQSHGPWEWDSIARKRGAG